MRCHDNARRSAAPQHLRRFDIKGKRGICRAGKHGLRGTHHNRSTRLVRERREQLDDSGTIRRRKPGRERVGKIDHRDIAWSGKRQRTGKPRSRRSGNLPDTLRSERSYLEACQMLQRVGFRARKPQRVRNRLLNRLLKILVEHAVQHAHAHRATPAKLRAPPSRTLLPRHHERARRRRYRAGDGK